MQFYSKHTEMNELTRVTVKTFIKHKYYIFGIIRLQIIHILLEYNDIFSKYFYLLYELPHMKFYLLNYKNLNGREVSNFLNCV